MSKSECYPIVDARRRRDPPAASGAVVSTRRSRSRRRSSMKLCVVATMFALTFLSCRETHAATLLFGANSEGNSANAIADSSHQLPSPQQKHLASTPRRNDDTAATITKTSGGSGEEIAAASPAVDDAKHQPLLGLLGSSSDADAALLRESLSGADLANVYRFCTLLPILEASGQLTKSEQSQQICDRLLAMLRPMVAMGTSPAQRQQHELGGSNDKRTRYGNIVAEENGGDDDDDVDEIEVLLVPV